MKDLILIPDKCPICGKPSYKGKSTTTFLGYGCKAHPVKALEIFKSENFDFSECEFKLSLNPFIRKYSVDIVWKVKLMLNGKIGTITQPQPYSSVLIYPDGEHVWLACTLLDLFRLYKQTGVFDPLMNVEFTATIPKITPTEQPKYPLEFREDKGQITGVSADVPYYNEHDDTVLKLIKQFCYLFILSAFPGVEQAPAFEGGFFAHNIEIKQKTSALGIFDASFDYPKTFEQQALVSEIILAWHKLARALLCYEWENRVLKTPQEIWSTYQTLQALALQVMSLHELHLIEMKAFEIYANPYEFVD